MNVGKLKEQTEGAERYTRKYKSATFINEGSPKGMLTSKLDCINFMYCDHDDDDDDVDVDQQTTPNHLYSHATCCSQRIYGGDRRQ